MMESDSEEYAHAVEMEISLRRKHRAKVRKLERIVENQADMCLKLEHKYADLHRRLLCTTELFHQRCEDLAAKFQDLELHVEEELVANKNLQTEVSGLAGARSTARAWCEDTARDLSQLLQCKHDEYAKQINDCGRRCETLEGKIAGMERSLTLDQSMAERALDIHAVESPRQMSLIQKLAARVDRLEGVAKMPNIGQPMNVTSFSRIDADSCTRYEVKEDDVPVFDTPDHNQRKRLACLCKGDVIIVKQEHRAPVFGGQFFDVYGFIDTPSSGWVLLQYERRCGMVDWMGCEKL